MPSLSLSFVAPSYSRQDIGKMLILYFAYIAAAQLGYFLFTAPAVIQPAAGVALAGLVLGGIALWPAIFAAALTNLLFGGADTVPLIFSVTAQTLHAVLGAYVLTKLGFDPVFRRVRDTLLFILVALTVSMLIPSLGLIGHYLNATYLGGNLPSVTWLSWWSGIMIGDLVLAAFLIRYFAKPTFMRTRTEIFELVAAFSSLALITYLVSWTGASQATNGVLVIFFILPFIWFSLRLGNRFTFLAFLMTTAIVLTGVLYGTAPSEQTVGYRIIVSELFMAVLAVIFYLFTAVVEERKRASKQLHAQLTRVGSLLEEKTREDRAKSDFIAVFAHELRNPLAPIVSSVELLKFKFGAHPEIAPLLETVNDRTKTIVRLLDDLLDVSRISRRTFTLRREEYDVRESVQNVASAMMLLAERSGLTLRARVPERPVIVNADPVRIEQMLGNLLMNAIKYTESGGSISISLEAEEDQAIFRIKDTGIGIAPEVLGRIFVPFAGLGVEQRQRSVKEGLGIGLWLTENLVKEHGGSIEAKSEGLGRGSEFVVTLPRITSHVLQSSEPERMQPMQNGKMRILVVDDNDAAAQGLATLLEHVGNDVATVFTGSEVAEKASEFRPDVIVLDIGLPDISGYEVAEKLRTSGYRGKIIALTGYGQEEDKQKAAAAGFNHHLTKPVGIADLQAVLVAT